MLGGVRLLQYLWRRVERVLVTFTRIIEQPLTLKTIFGGLRFFSVPTLNQHAYRRHHNTLPIYPVIMV